MNHIGLYFIGVLVVLMAFSIGMVFVARATRWKQKPIRPVRAFLFIGGAVFVAGLVCSIAGHDIHILYWWLAGAPAAAVFIAVLYAVLVGTMNSLSAWLHRNK